jgi:hypothetical protein
MNVYYNAFSAKLEDAVGLSMDGFWLSLCEPGEPLEVTHDGAARVISGHAFKGMFCFLIATVRDDRYLPTIRKGKEGWLIEASELDTGQSLVDFNLCVVSRKTGNGLYMEYKNSLRLNSACMLFGRLYKKYGEAEEKRAEDLVRQQHERHLKTEAYIQREARKLCARGKASVAPMVSKESFNSILADAQRINTLTYDVIDDKEPIFRSATDVVRSVKKVIRFDASCTSTVRELIADMLRTRKGRRQLEGASLTVVSGQDNEQTVYVGENRLPIEVGDYDDVKLALADVKEMSKFHHSRVVETMHQICLRKAAIFGKGTKHDLDDV